MHPIRVRRVTLLFLDDPPLAVPREREHTLAPRHPDPRHGVHLLQQRREDEFVDSLRRARFALDEQHAADRDQSRHGENQNRTSTTHRPCPP